MVLVDDDSQAEAQKDTLFKCFDEWTSKNELCNINECLWFIPLHEDDHYLCVCINFVKKKVEILDNQIQGKANIPRMNRIVNVLVCFSFCICVNLRVVQLLCKSLISFLVCFDVGIVLMYW